MTTLPRRSQVPDDLRDLYKRVRILEALNNGLGSSGRQFETCSDFILAQPTLFSFWPMNDVSGGAVDVFAGRDLTEDPKEGYPLYGQTGPYAGIPTDTSIQVTGDSGAGPNDFQRLDGTLTLAERNAIFNAQHAWTIEFWLYPLVAAAGAAFTYWAGSSVAQDNVYINHGAAGEIVVGRGAETLIAVGTAPLLTWTHVRLTYDGATLRIYLNGTLDNSVASASSLSMPSTFQVFNNVTNTGTHTQPLNGRMAYLAFYTSAVSTFCDPEGGGGGPCMGEGYVPVTDDDCGWSWAYPLEVTY